MTLTDGKILMEKHRIPYQTVQYENQEAYYRHLALFPYTKNARNCKVIALVIPAVNGVMDIELQFNQVRGEYIFDDMYFGDYCFEMFDYNPDMLEADLLENIGRIVDGKMAVIVRNDLKRKRWLGDAGFDLTDDDNVFGEPGFRAAVARIEKPKTLWQKLTGQREQYEIYDWRTYRRVIK